MRIAIYSFVALFIKLRFREPFRENPLPLPGSFRDSAFFLFDMFWWRFPGTTDRENDQESAASSKEHRLMLSASILTYLAAWRQNGKSCPALLAINSAHMQKHHAQLTFNLKFLAHCSPRTTFGLLPSGYPSVSLPGKLGNYFRHFLDLAGDLGSIFISQKSNHGIVQNLFWTRKLDKWQKNFREPFRKNPPPLPGSFRDCRILQCQKTAGKHLDKQ